MDIALRVVLTSGGPLVRCSVLVIGNDCLLLFLFIIGLFTFLLVCRNVFIVGVTFETGFLVFGFLFISSLVCRNVFIDRTGTDGDANINGF